MAGWVRLEGSAGSHVLPPPCSSRIVLEHFHSIASRCFWRITSEENSTPSLGNCSSVRSPNSKEVLPHIGVELPMYHFLPLGSCPVAGRHPAELGPSSEVSLPIGTGTGGVPSQLSLLEAEQAQLLQSFPVKEAKNVFHPSVVPSLWSP